MTSMATFTSPEQFFPRKDFAFPRHEFGAKKEIYLLEQSDAKSIRGCTMT